MTQIFKINCHLCADTSYSNKDNELVMKGDKINKMHDSPFRLLQITLTDENGKLRSKPMWLIVFGHRRNELNLLQCRRCYCQRYNLEQF